MKQNEDHDSDMLNMEDSSESVGDKKLEKLAKQLFN